MINIAIRIIVNVVMLSIHCPSNREILEATLNSVFKTYLLTWTAMSLAHIITLGTVTQRTAEPLSSSRGERSAGVPLVRLMSQSTSSVLCSSVVGFHLSRILSESPWPCISAFH